MKNADTTNNKKVEKNIKQSNTVPIERTSKNYNKTIRKNKTNTTKKKGKEQWKLTQT